MSDHDWTTLQPLCHGLQIVMKETMAEAAEGNEVAQRFAHAIYDSTEHAIATVMEASGLDLTDEDDLYAFLHGFSFAAITHHEALHVCEWLFNTAHGEDACKTLHLTAISSLMPVMALIPLHKVFV